MSVSGRFKAVLAVAVAAVLAVGCGEAIDATKAGELLQENLENNGRKVASVDCPSGVPVKAGETFDCDVKLTNGRAETARLKVVNDKADISIVYVRPKTAK